MRGHADIVVIVFPFATLPGIQDIADILSDSLSEHGFNTVVQLSGPVRTGAYQRVRYVAESLRPAGVIDLGGLTSQDHEELQALGSTVVGTAVDSRGAGSNVAFGRAQAEHLVDRGYRELAYAFLTDERGHPFDEGRTDGAREVCARYGLAEPYLFGVPLDSDGATSAVATMLKDVPVPLGIASFNDDVALAVLHAARALGRSVPTELGIIGVGRGPVGQLTEPGLSSVWADTRPLLGSLLRAFLSEHGVEGVGSGIEVPELEVVQGGTT